MRILVSACLLGTCCKYNGGHNRNEDVLKITKGNEIIPVCPEMLGGLSCPRVPCEIQQNKVIGKDGKDYTENYQKGVNKVLEMIKDKPIDLAILQARSPSCGVSMIYDGTFSKRLIAGSGLLARALKDLDIPCMEA